MTGVLVEAGLGRLTTAGVRDILASRDRQCFARPAPAHGLFLVAVNYPPSALLYDPTTASPIGAHNENEDDSHADDDVE